MNRLLLLLVFAGCAEATDVDSQDGAKDGAAFDAMADPPDLGADARLPTEDASEPLADAAGTCSPGAQLGLCAVCGLDGHQTVAEDDPLCPAIDCSAFDNYERVTEDGFETCYRDLHRPPADLGRCLRPFSCRGATESLCAESVRVRAIQASEPCQIIDGCVGNTPPVLRDAAPGTPCALGICTAEGTCDEDALTKCQAFSTAPLCAEGVDSTAVEFCELDVTGDVSCLETCQGFNTHCIRAWKAAEACRIDPLQELGCLTAAPGERLVCRCARP